MKNWVFDLDGTLVDSHKPYFYSLSEVLKSYGAVLTKDDEQEVLRISAKERPTFFARKVGALKGPVASKQMEARMATDHLHTEVFSGVFELLNELKSKNTNIAVWTAREKSSAVQLLEHTGLDEYISLCVGSTCVEKCKPNPEGLLKVAKYFNCQPIDMHMVGDHDNDMLAARTAGAKGLRCYWHDNSVAVNCMIADQRFNRVCDMISWINL